MAVFDPHLQFMMHDGQGLHIDRPHTDSRDRSESFHPTAERETQALSGLSMHNL
jgi:hypothetical protein